MMIQHYIHMSFLSVSKGTTVLVKKKVAKHTRTLREDSRGACAREAFALFAY